MISINSQKKWVFVPFLNFPAIFFNGEKFIKTKAVLATETHYSYYNHSYFYMPCILFVGTLR